MVMAQSLFIALKQQHGRAKITVLAPQWTVPLLTRMPEVDATLPVDFQHGVLNFAERRALAIRLRPAKFHQAIILPGSYKSALVPFWAGISKRTGYLGEMRWGLINDRRPLNKKKLAMTVERFVALGSEINRPLTSAYPLPHLVVDEENIRVICNRLNINPSEKPVLVLCPGAEYGPAKCWPAEHFAELARQKLSENWQVWILGSENDANTATQIQLATQNHCMNLAGQTKLVDAVDLMSLAKIVVSNDSGLMHIAAAVDAKLVALYGSSSPEFTPPLSRQQTILRTGIECSPCFKRSCPLGHTKCLTEISPDMVARAVQSLAPRESVV